VDHPKSAKISPQNKGFIPRRESGFFDHRCKVVLCGSGQNGQTIPVAVAQPLGDHLGPWIKLTRSNI
jgi:hypothetical protein